MQEKVLRKLFLGFIHIHILHHAKIKVNSKIGCGSKFEVILKDNFLESTKENRSNIEDFIIDKESIDLEFSDIYLA